MSRESKTEKAQRFINEHRVHRLSDDAWVVVGDTKPYLVCVPDRLAAQKLNAPVVSCTCESTVVCSHMLAAEGVKNHIAGGGTY